MISDTPKPHQHIFATRRRDGKYFEGWVESVRNMGERGIMVVVGGWDAEWQQRKFATIYLNDCDDVAWWTPNPDLI